LLNINWKFKKRWLPSTCRLPTTRDWTKVSKPYVCLLDPRNVHPSRNSIPPALRIWVRRCFFLLVTCRKNLVLTFVGWRGSKLLTKEVRCRWNRSLWLYWRERSTKVLRSMKIPAFSSISLTQICTKGLVFRKISTMSTFLLRIRIEVW
jgi:hypothetical protein